MRYFVRESIGILVVAFIIFLLFRLVLGSHYVVSESMEPGIQSGQRLLVNKLAYKFREPLRGDIVYFKSVQSELSQMKRIIGLPGDIVEVRDGTVYLNGQELCEPYIADQSAYTITQYQVPPANFFVLADNRKIHDDSSTGWTLPVENIQGKAWIMTWPPVKWGDVGNYNLSSQIATFEATE